QARAGEIYLRHGADRLQRTLVPPSATWCLKTVISCRNYLRCPLQRSVVRRQCGCWRKAEAEAEAQAWPNELRIRVALTPLRNCITERNCTALPSSLCSRTGSSFLGGRSTTNGARNVCNPSSRHRTSFLSTAPLLGSRRRP